MRKVSIRIHKSNHLFLLQFMLSMLNKTPGYCQDIFRFEGKTGTLLCPLQQILLLLPNLEISNSFLSKNPKLSTEKRFKEVLMFFFRILQQIWHLFPMRIN